MQNKDRGGAADGTRSMDLPHEKVLHARIKDTGKSQSRAQTYSLIQNCSSLFETITTPLYFCGNRDSLPRDTPEASQGQPKLFMSNANIAHIL